MTPTTIKLLVTTTCTTSSSPFGMLAGVIVGFSVVALAFYGWTKVAQHS